MQSSYIVRSDDDLMYCFYYMEGSGVQSRIYENGRWSACSVLADASKPNYTVNISHDGKIYIFYQDSDNNINLCSNRNGGWKMQRVLKSQHGTAPDIVFNAVIAENGLNLLYNVPNEDGKSQTLVSQLLNNKGQWGKPNRIESCVPLPRQIFQMQPITSGHGLVFYQTKTPETNIGYREIDEGNVGGFNIFHTTTYPVTDYTFLTTNSAVHVAFIIKGMFSCQLIYRVKTGTAFSNPVVVWEGQKLENCLLAYVKGSLKIFFTAGEQLYVCGAENGNTKFTAPARYRNKFCQNPVKAVYLSVNQMDESDFYCREIYVDSLCPWDVQILPDMYEDFYPVVRMSAVDEKKDEKSKGKYTDELLAEISGLKKQLDLAQIQLLEKDKKIKMLMENLIE